MTRTPSLPSAAQRLAFPLLLAAASACTGKYIRPTTAEKINATPEMVARGQYLVNQVSGCPACHTPRVDGSWLNGNRTDAYLAGGQRFEDKENGFGLTTPNITPDVETGIGGWSDDEIRRAIRDGVAKGDKLLFPPMPFSSFQFMSDDDVNSIVAYLRTVPPVKNKVDRTYDMGGGIKFAVKMGLVHHKPAMNVPPPDKTNKVAYGRYIAIGASICTDCHSLTDKGPNNEKNLFGGSQVPLAEVGTGKVWARNLTPDMETGLGKYSADQIKAALRNGVRLDGKKMAVPMALVIPFTSGMAEEDLDALIAYLKSIPPISHKVPDYEIPPDVKAKEGL
jgi:mono/diheme cytochrome c family protein